jgi:hypothetical protein
MPRYNSYSPFDRNIIKNQTLIEKLDNNSPSIPTCPAGSVYDTVNPKISTSKPCHCLNPDRTYSKKWIYVDGAC